MRYTRNKGKIGLALFALGSIMLLVSLYLEIVRSVPMHHFDNVGCLSCYDAFELFSIQIRILAMFGAVIAGVGLLAYVSHKASFSLISL